MSKYLTLFAILALFAAPVMAQDTDTRTVNVYLNVAGTFDLFLNGSDDDDTSANGELNFSVANSGEFTAETKHIEVTWWCNFETHIEASLSGDDADKFTLVADESSTGSITGGVWSSLTIGPGTNDEGTPEVFGVQRNTVDWDTLSGDYDATVTVTIITP
jgi:hypothetical protein